MPFNFVLKENLEEKRERKTTLNEKCRVTATPQWIIGRILLRSVCISKARNEINSQGLQTVCCNEEKSCVVKSLDSTGFVYLLAGCVL